MQHRLGTPLQKQSAILFKLTVLITLSLIIVGSYGSRVLAGSNTVSIPINNDMIPSEVAGPIGDLTSSRLSGTTDNESVFYGLDLSSICQQATVSRLDISIEVTDATYNSIDNTQYLNAQLVDMSSGSPSLHRGGISNNSGFIGSPPDYLYVLRSDDQSQENGGSGNSDIGILSFFADQNLSLANLSSSMIGLSHGYTNLPGDAQMTTKLPVVTVTYDDSACPGAVTANPDPGTSADIVMYCPSPGNTSQLLTPEGDCDGDGISNQQEGDYKDSDGDGILDYLDAFDNSKMYLAETGADLMLVFKVASLSIIVGLAMLRFKLDRI